MLNRENKIEMALKAHADYLGYYLRGISTMDVYYNNLGPYYLVFKSTGRIEHRKMTLNEVYKLLEKKVEGQRNSLM